MLVHAPDFVLYIIVICIVLICVHCSCICIFVIYLAGMPVCVETVLVYSIFFRCVNFSKCSIDTE
jgi:hypothetical protein